ncbi:uncharacterized protein LOC125672300 [Ostrea edulis]|uniref:uncharacterized protein LOC125672300 n=1 Tax=Ostrea edulis TaxID=37623 RepID=UPI0024AEF5F6|nr:uncharacterized protein LOC125672300 [Ostrea edulis]
MDSLGVLVLLAVGCLLPSLILAHGRLIMPPSRSSMWRYGFPTPRNNMDMQLWCGGKWNQWGHNGGKCGVCGDPYQQKPRENEAGGKYATGIISKCYPYNSSGQTVTIKVELTANHLGYFEFRLCEHNDTSTPISQSCLDGNLLRFSDNTTRYNVRDGVYGVINLQLQVPATVLCTQCVLQWKYNTGNSWGCDGGGCGMGRGMQEQFYGCADIAILRSCDHFTGLEHHSIFPNIPNFFIGNIF